MLRRLVLIIFCVATSILTPLAAASTGPEKLSDPGMEARAVALQRQLRCVVCQGQSLDESNAPLAADLRRLIRRLMENGWSDAQIENYLVARYGDFVLMKPPLEPETYLLWFGPLIVVLIGGGVAGTAIMRARRNSRAGMPG
ncbi:MAG TPA: cytochrome c-type biogenesis protein [Rhizomicrobium sp.]|jgi:cytochrome c-type biogenesis protein CcmH|nr:cytochrome c-type biogenesis protein [Rhizomicrobium sp.]